MCVCVCVNVYSSISTVFSWDTVLANNLPLYIKGMICVLTSTAKTIDGKLQVYSFEIEGGTGLSI